MRFRIRDLWITVLPKKNQEAEEAANLGQVPPQPAATPFGIGGCPPHTACFVGTVAPPQPWMAGAVQAACLGTHCPPPSGCTPGTTYANWPPYFAAACHMATQCPCPSGCTDGTLSTYGAVAAASVGSGPFGLEQIELFRNQLRATISQLDAAEEAMGLPQNIEDLDEVEAQLREALEVIQARKQDLGDAEGE